jgi:hypothetical protein
MSYPSLSLARFILFLLHLHRRVAVALTAALAALVVPFLDLLALFLLRGLLRLLLLPSILALLLFLGLLSLESLGLFDQPSEMALFGDGLEKVHDEGDVVVFAAGVFALGVRCVKEIYLIFLQLCFFFIHHKIPMLDLAEIFLKRFFDFFNIFRDISLI